MSSPRANVEKAPTHVFRNFAPEVVIKISAFYTDTPCNIPWEVYYQFSDLFDDLHKWGDLKNHYIKPGLLKDSFVVPLSSEFSTYTYFYTMKYPVGANIPTNSGARFWAEGEITSLGFSRMSESWMGFINAIRIGKYWVRVGQIQNFSVSVQF